MSATTASPVAGERFQQAVRLPIEGQKRRKLLCLVAAYQDADPEYRPSVTELAARLGRKPRAVMALLDRLELDGWITIHREPPGRARYELHLDGPR